MKKKLTLTILGVFVAVVGVATAQVALRTRVIRSGYQLGERMDEIRALEQENRQLRLELSLLKSPERIERLAREQLGLVRPDPQKMRVVRVGQRLATAAQPAGKVE